MNRASIVEFWQKNKMLLIIAVSAVVVGLLVWAGIAQYRLSVRNEGMAYQNSVMRAAGDIENNLSTCLDNSYQAAQVTKAQYDSVKDILVETAKARYVDPKGDITSANDVLGGGKMISVLVENNPTIDQSGWQRLMDVVINCRKDVLQAQGKMLFIKEQFLNWIQQGNIFNHGIRASFPNEKLTARDGERSAELGYDVILTGQAALDHLTRVISTKAAKDAIDNGEMPDQQLFPSNPPAPAPTPSR